MEVEMGALGGVGISLVDCSLLLLKRPLPLRLFKWAEVKTVKSFVKMFQVPEIDLEEKRTIFRRIVSHGKANFALYLPDLPPDSIHIQPDSCDVPLWSCKT